MITRILKLLIGVPTFLIGLGLAILAVVGLFVEKAGADRTIAVIMLVVSLILMAGGYTLCKSRPRIPTAPVLAHDGSPLRYVTVDRRGSITVSVRTTDEVVASLKELRVVKKGFALQKRVIIDKQKAVRAKYTDGVRRRGSKWIGGGSFGKDMRRGETVMRDWARYRLATSLAPLEAEKQRIEAAINAVDLKIAQFDAILTRPT